MKLPTKPTIIIDTREQHPLFTPEDKDEAVGSFISEKVDAGDYTVKEIPNLVVIERKADGKELYSNLILKKDVFLRSVERMRAFKHKYIIIQQSYNEFLDPKTWTFINPFKRRFGAMAAVEAWLISLSQSENIHFIFAGKTNSGRIVKRILLKTYEYERKKLRNQENEQTNKQDETQELPQ